MLPEKIVISGKEYVPRFSFNSLIAMEEKHNLNVFAGFKNSPKTTAILIWGAVIDAEPVMTLERVAAGIRVEDMDKFGAIALTKLLEQLPKKDDEAPAAVGG
jgi:hypothetical protein